MRPCKALSPALERAEAARTGKVVLAKVDVDSNQRLAAQFQVQGIPAVKAVRDGAVADEFVGAGVVARIRLAEAGVGKEAFEALGRGERDAALDGLLRELDGVDEDAREDLRRAIVGILTELDPADPDARAYRRKLATALG